MVACMFEIGLDQWRLSTIFSRPLHLAVLIVAIFFSLYII